MMILSSYLKHCVYITVFDCLGHTFGLVYIYPQTFKGFELLNVGCLTTFGLINYDSNVVHVLNTFEIQCVHAT